MMNIKRISALLLAMTLGLAGCAQEQTAVSESAAPEESAETTETTETTSTEETVERVTVNYSAGLQEDGNLTNTSLKDLVTLPDLSKIELSAADAVVTEEEVEAEILSILENLKETRQVKDRETVLGDTVNIDYVGTIDGVAFDGGNTNGYGADLVLGSHSYIDTFEDQLVGHKPGETVEVKVTFPENYGAADLAGKAAVFTTTINYIKEEGIPELTDELVAEKLKDTYSATTVEGFRLAVREYMETDKKYTVLWNWLSENVKFSGEPEELSELLLGNYVDLFKMYAQSYGLSLEDYLKNFQLNSEEDLRNQYREEAANAARRYVITQAIGDQLNLVIDEDVLNDYFKGQDYSDLVNYYGDGYVHMQVKFTKIYEKLLETTEFK